jgi:predicted dehydrogenase
MPIWFPRGPNLGVRLQAQQRVNGFVLPNVSPAGPDRDGPDRDGPDRDGPDRDGPDRDGTANGRPRRGAAPGLQDTLAGLGRPGASPVAARPMSAPPATGTPIGTGSPVATPPLPRDGQLPAGQGDNPGVPLRPATARAAVAHAPGTVRVGVVGVGYWGVKHVRALEKVEGVSAVVAIDERLADEPDGSLAAMGIDQYGDLTCALSKVDALVIATPPSTHYSVGLQAIAAGKHVLIEKPLATNAGEARALIAAAEAAGVVLMSGHTFEHNAAVHKLRELIRERDLGQLYYLDCARLNLGLYRDDVGVIADLAPHDISIANYVLSSRPTTVTAWGSRFVGVDHEDVAFLRLDYADIGVRASVQVSWLSPVKVRRVTAVGSRRMAVYDDTAEDERIRIYDKSAIPPEKGSGNRQGMRYHQGDTVLPHVDFAEPLAVQDQEFVSCIRTGRQPAADGMSGLSVVQVLDAAQISLREQRPVSIAEISQIPAPAAARYGGLKQRRD